MHQKDALKWIPHSFRISSPVHFAFCSWRRKISSDIALAKNLGAWHNRGASRHTRGITVPKTFNWLLNTRVGAHFSFQYERFNQKIMTESILLPVGISDGLVLSGVGWSVLFTIALPFVCGVGWGPVVRLITADLTVGVAAEVFTLRWLGSNERVSYWVNFWLTWCEWVVISKLPALNQACVVFGSTEAYRT